jgi:hypothetical protein
MISRDEALARARGWAVRLWPEHTPEVCLHEFALGWVAWPTPAAPRDPARAPSSIGEPQVVIDRETGDLVRWPSTPASVIAEKYTAMKAADDRFPPDVRQALDDAGWFPGRDISAAVDQWEKDFAGQLAGMTFYPAVRAAMCEFGALSIAQFAAPDGGDHSHVFPTGGVGVDRAEGFMDKYQHTVFPLGDYQDGPAELVMDQQGQVFILHWANDWYLGANIDAALISLVCRGRWPEAADRTWEDGQSRRRMDE